MQYNTNNTKKTKEFDLSKNDLSKNSSGESDITHNLEEAPSDIDDLPIDHDIKSLLKYRLLLAEVTEDNILTHIIMLRKLKEAYDKYKVPIPKKVRDYIVYETLRIYEEIELLRKKAA